MKTRQPMRSVSTLCSLHSPGAPGIAERLLAEALRSLLRNLQPVTLFLYTDYKEMFWSTQIATAQSLALQRSHDLHFSHGAAGNGKFTPAARHRA